MHLTSNCQKVSDVRARQASRECEFWRQGPPHRKLVSLTEGIQRRIASPTHKCVVSLLFPPVQVFPRPSTAPGHRKHPDWAICVEECLFNKSTSCYLFFWPLHRQKSLLSLPLVISPLTDIRWTTSTIRQSNNFVFNSMHLAHPTVSCKNHYSSFCNAYSLQTTSSFQTTI